MYFTGSTADAWDNLFITILSFHAILHYSWKYLINGTAHLPLKIFFYFQYLFLFLCFIVFREQFQYFLCLYK